MFRSRSLLKQVFNDVDKVSTRVYGLPAVKNSRQVLRGLLKKHIATARELDNGRNIAYNMSEMKNCAWRLHICDTAETVREIEVRRRERVCVWICACACVCVYVCACCLNV